jgi:purine-binding chemotaxis protein CheW
MSTIPNQDTPRQQAKAIIDWSEIRRRVEAVRETLTRGAVPSPEEKRSILKARAHTLAKEPAPVGKTQEFLPIVQFRLGSETYGIESSFVREVYPLKDFTPLPGTPSFVLGVVNVRGQILSVVDLKKFFNIPEKSLGELNKVIIIRGERMEFGILADIILGAHSILLETIQAALPTVTGIGAEYLRGVTGERVIVLDAEKILCDPKIIVQQETE